MDVSMAYSAWHDVLDLRWSERTWTIGQIVVGQINPISYTKGLGGIQKRFRLLIS